MAETPPQTGRTPEENLTELRGALGAGGRDQAELANLAINAVGDLNVDPADTARVDELNNRLDAVLELADGGELGAAMLARIDELEAADNGPGLNSEQQRQIAIIKALVDRNAAVAASATAAPGTGGASVAAAAWRTRASNRPAGAAAPGGAGGAGRGGGAGAAAHRRRAGAGGARSAPGGAPGPAPAAANRTRDDYDTLTKRFRFLAERAQLANAQKGNGHERERNLSADEALLREILRALDVNPEVELPMTRYRQSPEIGMQESVEDSLEFIAEARELYLQLRDRPLVPANPAPGARVFQYKGPKIGKGEVISGDLVDRLGELTNFSRWIVDPLTQDDFRDTLRELFIAEKKRRLTDGEQGMRQGLKRAFEAAGWSENEKRPRTDPIFRVSRRGPGGAVSQDLEHPMWNLDSMLINFHRAQILKRMMLSNELKVAGRVDSVRRSMYRRGDDPTDPGYPAELDRRMGPHIGRITGFADHVDDSYRHWLRHLYDGIDPRDGTLVMPGSPVPPPPPRGGGGHHGPDRYPVGVRLHHNAFPQVGATALGDTLIGAWGVVPPAQPGHTARGFRSQGSGARSAPRAKPVANSDPDVLPSEQTKQRINKLYREDLARRRAERREARSLRRRMRVAGFAGGVLLALPEPIQGRVGAAVQRGNAKRKGRLVPSQSHS